MQLYLRSFFNILRQHNNFEWTLENHKYFDEIKKSFSPNRFQIQFQTQKKRFAICDASNFDIGTALLQSQQGTENEYDFSRNLDSPHS